MTTVLLIIAAFLAFGWLATAVVAVWAARLAVALYDTIERETEDTPVAQQ